MSQVLFVGGPLHGSRRDVPDDLHTYLVPVPADLALSLLDPEPTTIVPPIQYQRVRWPYRVEWEDHQFVMLGPVTEERPSFHRRAGEDPQYAYIADRMWMVRAESLIPQCVVPDCTDKGRYAFVAAEDGRLAGRDWKLGDKIRICPPHASDIYRAQGVYGIEHLAEWLRPDARLDPFDAYDAAADVIYGPEIAAAQARMLRMRDERPS